MSRKKIIAIIGVIVACILAAVIFYSVVWSPHITAVPTRPASQVRADLPQYKYINPLLFSDNPKSTDPNYTNLMNAMQNYISAKQKAGEATSISVYFRDLETAQWTGVNEAEKYTPSSMLKVLAMMAALKIAETEPSILSEKLPYTISSSTLQYFKPDDNLTNGSYPVQELIGAMIKYSDNDALYALLSDQRINEEFNTLYGLFRLPSDPATIPVDFMSPKSFSVVFRTLYNSTIFEWGLSEQILSLLTTTTFTNGLVAGVPSTVAVAHKFGEKANTDQANNVVSRELHDCGIIYYPNHPYLLCVMTRGNDFTQLEDVISGLSKTVYNYVGANLVN